MRLCAGVLAVLAVLEPGAPARAEDAASLRFEREGALVRELTLASLRAACHETRIALDDPYHGRRKTYLACPLAEVLAAGFGDSLADAAGADFFLRARDGYTKPSTGARLLEPGGYVAFADLSNPAGPDAGWESIDRRRVDPAPFYLVWAGPGQQDVHRYPWPYQLAAIERAPFEREFPHTLPRGEPPDSAAWTGFAVFRAECVACHAVNGEGGRVGPELNVPRSIVEYRPTEQIKAYVRDPQSFRYTSMPAHAHLSDAELDGLVAYFRAMSERKRDPGGRRMHREAAPLRSFGSLLEVGSTPLETQHGAFTAHVFQNLATRRPTLVLTRGDVRSQPPLLARVHSSCVTSESLCGCDCDCAAQLDASLARIAEEGRGALFYLLQEGRGAGIAAKARDRMIVQSSDHQITTFEAYDLMGLGRDLRRYEEVAFACQLLRIAAPLRLLTNNPEKRAAIEAEGVVLAETLALRGDSCAESQHYLASKSRTGHALDDPGDGAAALPGALRYFDPHPLPDAPEIVRVASYWLPIRIAGGDTAHWLRLELFESPEGERIVLERVGRGAPCLLLRLERCDLLDRLRLGGHRRWQAAAAALIEGQAGVASFEPTRVGGDGASEPDRFSLALLARAVGQRRARLVIDGPGESAFDRACAAALVQRGVRLDAPLDLAEHA